jgi:flagellar biosynthesis protein FlhB
VPPKSINVLTPLISIEEKIVDRTQIIIVILVSVLIIYFIIMACIDYIYGMKRRKVEQELEEIKKRLKEIKKEFGIESDGD